MPTQSLMPVFVTVAVVAFVLWRQLSPRRVKSDLTKMPVIFAVLGLFQTVQFFSSPTHGPVSLVQWVGLGLSLVCGAALALPRAESMRLWQTADGAWMRKGTAVTLLWWIASFGTHVLVGTVLPYLLGARGEGFMSATMFLYLAVILGVQGVRLERRIEAIAPGSRGAARAATPQDVVGGR